MPQPVSIRAPVTRPGRRGVRTGRRRAVARFQSAPRSLDRGDSSIRMSRVPITPVSIRAPVTRPGRRGAAGTGARADCRVSIRAPVTRPGRRGRFARPTSDADQFQSAPRSLDRGDSCAAHERALTGLVSIRAPVTRPGRPIAAVDGDARDTGFNPRPGHSTGATRYGVRVARIPLVSIRAPVTRPGRPDYRAVGLTGLFQSAPRSLDRGDSVGHLLPARLTMFQSAPRSLDRGDVAGHGADALARRCFNPRPGHSTGATAPTGAASWMQACVSIRAPVTRPGRHERIHIRAAMRICFNPRPGHSTGATPRHPDLARAVRRFNPRPGHSTGATPDCHTTADSRTNVSIRAPVTRPGRRVRNQLSTTLSEVSIRAPVTRPGRPASQAGELEPVCFNPRPGHSTGATREIAAPGEVPRCFNPRPGHSTGATLTARSAEPSLLMFQSAPRSLDRGDTADVGRQGHCPNRFNPRPGHSTGATCSR